MSYNFPSTDILLHINRIYDNKIISMNVKTLLFHVLKLIKLINKIQPYSLADL